MQCAHTHPFTHSSRLESLLYVRKAGRAQAEFSIGPLPFEAMAALIIQSFILSPFLHHWGFRRPEYPPWAYSCVYALTAPFFSRSSLHSDPFHELRFTWRGYLLLVVLFILRREILAKMGFDSTQSRSRTRSKNVNRIGILLKVCLSVWGCGGHLGPFLV